MHAWTKSDYVRGNELDGKVPLCSFGAEHFMLHPKPVSVEIDCRFDILNC